MIGWLAGIFDAILNFVGPFLRRIVDVVSRVQWFVVAAAGAVVYSVTYIFFFLGYLTGQAVIMTQDLRAEIAELVSSSGSGNASALWSSLANGAALANCVVPLDYAVAMGGALLSLWLVCMSIRVLLFFYRLLPFKFT